MFVALSTLSLCGHAGGRRALACRHKARKIQLRFYVSDIGLEPAASEKLIALVSTRYDLAQDEVTLTSARFPTAALNKEYLKQTLVKLVSAAKALAKAAEDGGAAGAGNTTTV